MNNEIKLKDLVVDKTTYDEFNCQIKDMKEKLNDIILPSLKIDSEIFKSLQELSEAASKTSTALISGLNKSIHLNLEDVTSSITHSIKIMINSFDWDEIREDLKIRILEYEEKLEHYDKDLWAVDLDLLDEQVFDDEVAVPLNMMETVVESKLELYMGLFKKESTYNPYSSILEQAYSAYKSGQYALAAFPLFAVIEGIISKTFEEYEIDLNLKPKLKHRKNQLFVKFSDYVESAEEELAINMLFFRRVFFVYQEVFKPSWDSHPEHINRNWIMHGSYNYEAITKKDILRLFQLIKALEVVKNISFEKAEVDK